MKAVLKSNRKVIVDVDPNFTNHVIQRDDGSFEFRMGSLLDETTGIYYRIKELDFVEYYGG